MSPKNVFVIRNQIDQYLNKQSQWISGKEAQLLYRSDFHDEALNTLIEVNAKEINLRGKIIEVELGDKKKPIIEVSQNAIEMEITEKAQKENSAAAQEVATPQSSQNQNPELQK
ncbi:MAG: hypothetical protein HRU20_21340 [Pseudomonadales bacterium]|nr:hypothetical protein [Pseudomonadales bacterium]